MPDRVAIGTKSTRADNSDWIKTGHNKWKQTKDGDSSPGQVAKGKAQDLGPRAGPDEEAQAPVEAPADATYDWEGNTLKYDLDGHRSEVANDLAVDGEGDIDSKPVVTWHDGARDRRSYTKNFHMRRHHALHTRAKARAPELAKQAEELRPKVRAGDTGAAMHLVQILTGLAPDVIRASRARVNRPEMVPKEKLEQAAARATDAWGSTEVRVEPPRDADNQYPFVGFVNYQGILVDLENLRGDKRSGTNQDGTPWEITMQAHYGEVRRTGMTRGGKGADGDQLDVYIGPDAASQSVYVVDQMVPETGAYDEQKVILGYRTFDDAIALYDAQYTKPGFRGEAYAVTIDEFKKWLSEPEHAGLRVAAVRIYGVDGESAPLEQSHTGDRGHRDRVHLAYTHPEGHEHVTSFHDPDVANHVAKGKHFEGPELEDHDVVRYLAQSRMACDLLSKMGPVEAPDDLARAQVVKEHLHHASEQIREHFGHALTHEDMSYIPPSVATAYTEANWPHAITVDPTSAPKPSTPAPAATSGVTGGAQAEIDKIDAIIQSVKGLPPQEASRVLWQSATALTPEGSDPTKTYQTLRAKLTAPRRNKKCSPNEASSSSTAHSSTHSSATKPSPSTPTTEALPSPTPTPSPPVSEVPSSPDVPPSIKIRLPDGRASEVEDEALRTSGVLEDILRVPGAVLEGPSDYALEVVYGDETGRVMLYVGDALVQSNLQALARNSMSSWTELTKSLYAFKDQKASEERTKKTRALWRKIKLAYDKGKLTHGEYVKVCDALSAHDYERVSSLVKLAQNARHLPIGATSERSDGTRMVKVDENTWRVDDSGKKDRPKAGSKRAERLNALRLKVAELKKQMKASPATKKEVLVQLKRVRTELQALLAHASDRLVQSAADIIREVEFAHAEIVHDVSDIIARFSPARSFLPWLSATKNEHRNMNDIITGVANAHPLVQDAFQALLDERGREGVAEVVYTVYGRPENS